jgi:uncharacterized damage-inducible protein DinB
MTHPLVNQLRFTRSEWRRALAGLPADDALRRFEPLNCISWMVGHLAWQENRYWSYFSLGQSVIPHVEPLVGYGKPASTPPLDEMWAAWETATKSADETLEAITEEMLPAFYEIAGKPVFESIGTLLQRNIYHYWFHTGEALAIRQLLGHTDLPEFVGSFPEWAHYQSE